MTVIVSQIVSFFTSLLLIVTNFLGISAPFTEKVDEFRVTTYIRGEYVQSPDSIHPEDFDHITHVILFECASFNSDGEVICNEPVLETALANILSAVADRKVHITLNLLGPHGITDSQIWEEQMEAQSDEHNKAFSSGVLEKNIIEVLGRYGFDGVHFDYEYPLSKNAWKHYNEFLVSLDKKLGEKYTLGVAASDWNLSFTAAAIEAVDTFEFMSYDMVDKDGRHATYEDTVKAVQKIGIYGIPFEKANIGLAFYSRPTDLSGYWYGYNGCYGEIDESGWYHCNSTGKDFWFNTPDVIRDKTDYAIKNGFGGVMMWHYSCDLSSAHEDSLLRAVAETVNKNY